MRATRFRLTDTRGTVARGVRARAVAAEVASSTPTKPVSEVRAGAGLPHRATAGISANTAASTMKVLYGLFDLRLVKRNDATGTWLRFDGRNIGLESRQLRFEHNRQGNWGYFIEYGRIPRYEPYTATTAVPASAARD